MLTIHYAEHIEAMRKLIQEEVDIALLPRREHKPFPSETEYRPMFYYEPALITRPDHPLAVIATPDARKGERLVLVTTKPGATRAEVQAFLKARGATELMAPAEVISLDTMPLLGSGKTDYVALNRLVRERAGAPA